MKRIKTGKKYHILCFLMLYSSTSPTHALSPVLHPYNENGSTNLMANIEVIKQNKVTDLASQSQYYFSLKSKDEIFDSKKYLTERAKFYSHIVMRGENLSDQCERRTETREFYGQEEKTRAINSLASSLQLIGLDVSIRSLVSLYKEMNMSQSELIDRVEGLVNQSCSHNLTLISHKQLKYFFYYLFYNSSAPSFVLPFGVGDDANLIISHLLDNKEVRKLQQSLSEKMFSEFCQFDTTKLKGSKKSKGERAFEKYSSNPYIMGLTIDFISENKNHSLRSLCSEDDATCRPSYNPSYFFEHFPKYLGVRNLKESVETLYCQEFYFKESSQLTEEDPFLQKHFLSLITTVPDLSLFELNNKNLFIFRSFDLLKEESLSRLKRRRPAFDVPYKVRVQNIGLDPYPINGLYSLHPLALHIDFTLGDFDDLIFFQDKIKIKKEFNLPSDLIEYIRRAAPTLENGSQNEKDFVETISRHITPLLNELKQDFFTPPFYSDLSDVVAQGLIEQVTSKYYPAEEGKLAAGFVPIQLEIGFGLLFLESMKHRKPKDDEKIIR